MPPPPRWASRGATRPPHHSRRTRCRQRVARHGRREAGISMRKGPIPGSTSSRPDPARMPVLEPHRRPVLLIAIDREEAAAYGLEIGVSVARRPGGPGRHPRPDPGRRPRTARGPPPRLPRRRPADAQGRAHLRRRGALAKRSIMAAGPLVRRGRRRIARQPGRSLGTIMMTRSCPVHRKGSYTRRVASGRPYLRFSSRKSLDRSRTPGGGGRGHPVVDAMHDGTEIRPQCANFIFVGVLHDIECSAAGRPGRPEGGPEGSGADGPSRSGLDDCLGRRRPRAETATWGGATMNDPAGPEKSSHSGVKPEIRADRSTISHRTDRNLDAAQDARRRHRSRPGGRCAPLVGLAGPPRDGRPVDGGPRLFARAAAVPMFAGFLLWSRRERLRSSPPRPAWWGLVLIAAGSRRPGRVRFYYSWLEGLGLLVSLAGLVAFWGGRRGLGLGRDPRSPFSFHHRSPCPTASRARLAVHRSRLATVASTYVLQTMMGTTAVSEGNIILIDEAKIGSSRPATALGCPRCWGIRGGGRGGERRGVADRVAIVLAPFHRPVRQRLPDRGGRVLLHRLGGEHGADAFYDDLAGWPMMPLRWPPSGSSSLLSALFPPPKPGREPSGCSRPPLPPARPECGDRALPTFS